jgi:hypothetical protein
MRVKGVEKNILYHKDHLWMQLESDVANWQIDEEYDQVH